MEFHNELMGGIGFESDVSRLFSPEERLWLEALALYVHDAKNGLSDVIEDLKLHGGKQLRYLVDHTDVDFDWLYKRLMTEVATVPVNLTFNGLDHESLGL